MSTSISSKFGPEVLLVFIGHSDDAKPEADAVRYLESELQRELERLLRVAAGTLTFKTVRMWEWNYDAPPGIGGQDDKITPDLDRANIAIFLFKERVGPVTWRELEHCRNRSDFPIPMAFFPANPPDPQLQSNIAFVEGWLDLLKKKRELTVDWLEKKSRSLTPTEEYKDTLHLKNIVLDQLKRAIDEVLRHQVQKELVAPTTEKTREFLGDYPHLSYDHRPVFTHTVEELDQNRLKSFLERPISREQIEKGSKGQVPLPVVEQLQILGCACDQQPTLGAFLCFAPLRLLTTESECCSLQMVVYDKISRADSSASITPVHGNLLDLFDEAMLWLTKESGLRRRGRVGTMDRDELEIPKIVLREALANALVHRDYETPALKIQPTRIEVYPDRVEITSFGSLPSSVPVDLLNGDAEKVVPVRRNPIITRIFQHMTYIELNASGVLRMQLEMRKASLALPLFLDNIQEDVVRVVLLRPSDLADETEVLAASRLPERAHTAYISGRLPQRPHTAYVSATTLDLPEHRKQVIEACLRESIFPISMEHLPPRDADAIRVSQEMVDKADIYIGVFAWRYGYIPEGHDISITEMEFNRAVERGIPILVFLIHKEHPLTFEMVETGEAAQKKLAALRERAAKGRIRAEFKSPLDLRGQVIQALHALEKQEQESSGEKNPPSFHPPNIIPQAPAPYVAHPYSLLQTKDVVGRQAELNLLTAWVANPRHEAYGAPIFNLVAIGGMGKSAFTWKWFNEIAPNELPKLAGRMWWSFCESDAHYENFIIRALAYVSRQPEQAVRAMTPPDREDQLLAILDQKPFLLVLDGLERILIAYARMDAAHLLDDDLDDRTANRISEACGLPDDVRETYLEKHRLRKTADPRAGAFLRRLATVRSSRILVTTRLYPADLQTSTAAPRPGCFAAFLTGLEDDDAINLWRAFGVSGSSDQLLPLFRAFGNFPLLIRALAGEVAEYRPAPGKFDQWKAAHPNFDPAALPLKNAKTQVLEFALRGLGEKQRKVLHTLSAFRMPATWDTLCALLAGKGKACRDDRDLDGVLTELEDRGLIGWDKKANRYDMHPIVRGVVWQALDGQARKDIYGELHTYFDAVPKLKDWKKVETLEDLTPTIELYHTLIGLERFDDAVVVFRDHLDYATLYRLSASRQRAEMLERLFPDGVDASPRLEGARNQSFALNSLALAYGYSGEPGRAAPHFRRCVEIFEREGAARNTAVGLGNLSEALRFSAALREAERAAREALGIGRREQDQFQEGVSLQFVGLALAACGNVPESEIALRRSLAIWITQKHRQSEGLVNGFLAQRLLWLGQPQPALSLAQRAWDLARVDRHERDFIRAARLHGAAALGVGDLATAAERLQHALTRARAVNLVEEELPTLTALAELHRQENDFAVARDLLDQVWEAAERGPYPLWHADALNVLAQIERDQGNRDAAVAAVTKAFTLAWCDGPPYAYQYGLTNARNQLTALGAPEPVLPPFDASKFEPMPDVELNPNDEFHVTPGA